jgi:NHLM bacteriocin system ABC transporter peptidase/ATP-binding protein
MAHQPMSVAAGGQAAPGAARPAIPARRRKRTPTVIQMEAVECGAAALAIVLGHYGRFVPLEELRGRCGVSRDGSTAGSVLRAARQFGLEGNGMQLDTADLPSLPLPAILFWKFDHFLVLEGYGRKVRLNDPATGPRPVTWEEFDRSFTGIALRLRPGPGFRPGGERRRVLAALLARRPRLGSVLYLAVLLGLIVAIAGLTMPVLTRVFVDDVLLGGGQGALGALIGALGTATALTLCAAALQQSLLVRAEAVFALGSAARFVRHLLRLPVVFFDQRQAADLTNRVRSNDVVADVLARRLASTAVDCVLVVSYGALLIRYNLMLGLLAVLFAGLNIAALRYVATLRTSAVAGLQADRGKLFATVYTTIHMIESVKAAGEEQAGFQRFASRAAAVASGQQRLGVSTAVLGVVPALLAALNTAALLWLGGYQVLAGTLSIGLLIGMQGMITSMNRPVTNLTVLASRLQETSADLSRLRDVENYPVPPAPRRAAPVAPLEGHLRIEGLVFGYNPLGKPVIDGLDLDLPPGSRVALAGGSGSGKSTIGRLVAGLYEPWSGRITVDGWLRGEVDPRLWAAAVAYVDHDQLLFEGTVRDNITFWDRTVGDDEVITALTDACVYTDIARRPGGLSSVVAEDGRNFSHGQRQRLEIARALVRRPAVLILDEATSALDAATEAAIDRNLRRRGATCLIIAHRLSTIRDCDLIAVLGAGGELERGTHEQLMASGGAYDRLIREE